MGSSAEDFYLLFKSREMSVNNEGIAGSACMGHITSAMTSVYLSASVFACRYTGKRKTAMLL